MTKTKTGRLNRMIAMLLMLIMVCGMLPTTSFAEGGTAQSDYSFYAVEFSYTDDEGNTTSYASRDVAKISVAKIAEQLGLAGAITAVDGSSPIKIYYTQEEADGWYLYTTSPGAQRVDDTYTGDLFDGRESRYFKENHDIVITIDGVEYNVVMKYIATPIQLNDPGAVNGVTVGDTIYTFASGMPLSTVYIDNDYFQTPSSWEKLTEEKGFVLRVPTEFIRAGGEFDDQDKTWAIYDPSVEGATQLVSTEENYFEGDLFSFTFDNAAILWNGTVANVKITYSDAYITIDKRATDGFSHSVLLACGKHMRVGSSDQARGTEEIDGEQYYSALSAGARMTATIQIVDDDGKPIDGSFIACVEGINISRYGSSATKPLDNGYLYTYWSETIQVNDGTLSDIYVRPNDEEEEPLLPDTTPYPYQRQWYYSYVTENDRGVKFTGVQWAVPDGDALVFNVGHNHYYSAGFVTTADAHSGIQFENHSAGTIRGSGTSLVYDTYYMDGYSIWHRIRSSSTRGGTIRTTTEGNVGGALSDGGTVLDPGTYVVPDGKTVVYTMTPDEGYELDKVIVKSDSLSYSEGTDITELVKAEPVYGADGAIAYYTYTFPADKDNPQNNHENQAIHVKWKKSTEADLTIKKTAVGGDGTFTFHVKVNGEQLHRDAWKAVASWETIWRDNYSFAYITSVSYPLVLDGVTYNDDVEQMSLKDDSVKLLLSGSFGEEPAYQEGDLNLYKVLDSNGRPYTITIDGTTYDLYSDTRDWSVSGIEGSNKANFWIHDTQDKVDNYFNISTVSETSVPETVDLFKSPYNGTTVPEKPGFYEFKIPTTDGEGSLTLAKLPYGYHYSVDELTPDGWTLTDSHNTTGNLKTDNTAGFTNEKDTFGDLTVTKTVEGNAPVAGAEFRFTVTLSDTSITGTYGEMSFTNGVATFTLKHGESKTASNLPNGITYEVTEADYTADGYVTTKTGDTGTIVGNSEQTAAFKNTRNADGSLTVSKTLEGNDTDSTKEFTFTITLSDPTINGTYSGVTFTNGVATITLKGGESKTIEGLPNGVGYEVTEADYSADGYVTTKTGDTGTIDENKPMVAAFTNTRDTYGDLVVTKTVAGNAASQTKEFTFTVTLSDTTINGTFGDMTFVDGVAEFTLKHGESKKAPGLPNGVGYTVVESDNSGYTVTKTGDTGSIIGGETVTAAFTNTKNTTPPPDDPSDDPKTGNLTVSKTVAGNGADQNKEFTFTVMLSSKINGTYGGITFTNGVATFTLKGGESKKATGLPEGITYEVTETDYSADGYVTTKTGDTGKIVANGTATADFTNTKTTTPPPPDNPPDNPPDTPPVTPPDTPEYGSLTVKKTVTGDLANKDQYFTFTITFNASGSYSYTGSKSGTIKSGEAVQLKHGESITISGLPAGTTYAVTESGHSGYRAYASGNTGTIAANKTSTAAFTNARSSVPQTGDDSNLLLWLSMAGAAGIGMVLTAIFGKKRKGKHIAAR